jgi:hypothetical protein
MWGDCHIGDVGPVSSADGKIEILQQPIVHLHFMPMD